VCPTLTKCVVMSRIFNSTPPNRSRASESHHCIPTKRAPPTRAKRIERHGRLLAKCHTWVTLVPLSVRNRTRLENALVHHRPADMRFLETPYARHLSVT